MPPTWATNWSPAIVCADQGTEAGIKAQRERIAILKEKLAALGTAQAKRLALLADYLVKKSVWIVGGDGWAYDIGYGGLDHVMASGRNVNILVLDTEVYSNTGGQASKSTPIGASAKFAMAGKALPKKDLGMIAMAYGNVYVAKVAMGAKDVQVAKAFQEAESYDGPSIIIAYSHCIAHGYDLVKGCEQQKLAVDSGHWPLFRYDPRRVEQGEGPLQMDSSAPKIDLGSYVRNETRYRMVEQQNPEHFRHLLAMAQREVTNRFATYENLAKLTMPIKDVDARSRQEVRVSLTSEAGPGAPAPAPRASAPGALPFRRSGRQERLNLVSHPPWRPYHESEDHLPGPAAGASRSWWAPRPLANDLDMVRRLEDAGVAAITMPSLFEEQITREQFGTLYDLEAGSESFAEATSYFANVGDIRLGPDNYLDQIRKVKAAVKVPGDRLAQRRHRQRLAGLRQADPAGRRRRPGAEPLLPGHQPPGDRRDGREARAGDRPHGQVQRDHPPGGQAFALLHLPGRTSPRCWKAPAPTPWCCSTASTSPTWTSRPWKWSPA